MIRALISRIRMGRSTIDYPGLKPELPARYRGVPAVDATLCSDGCRDCCDVCPTEALRIGTATDSPTFDLGRCLFCGDCVDKCNTGAIDLTSEFRMATTLREDLFTSDGSIKLARSFEGRLKDVLGRSLRLRVVSAGGCNGCEAELNALSNPIFDLARFGIDFVPSPRHADGLVVTGPVTHSMKLPLQATYRAIPDPKIVIAVGACAISGGPYIDHSTCNNGVVDLPVDLYVPGCAPHPLTILDGLLRLMGKLENEGLRD